MMATVQRPPRPTPGVPPNHPRPASSNSQPDRGRRLVRCQCDGGEEEERGRDGRARCGWCGGCIPCRTS
jgi:hypothetical protein